VALDVKIIKKKNYVYTVELKGSIDTETYQQLEDELDEIIDDKTKAIIISSIGIKIILSTKKSLERMNANFTMVNLQPQIKRVLDAMKILPMIDIFDDMPEADKYIDQVINEEIEKQAT